MNIIELSKYPNWLIDIDDPYNFVTIKLTEFILNVFDNITPFDKFDIGNVLILNRKSLDYLKDESPITQPMTYKNNIINVNYIISISCGSDIYWQYIYQLSHEVGHIIMKCFPDQNDLKWVAEIFAVLVCNIVYKKISEEFDYTICYSENSFLANYLRLFNI